MAEIKDSGSMREFGTGAHRDNATGKGRCDLLPMKQVEAAHEKIDSLITCYDINDVIPDMLDDALEAIINLKEAEYDITDKMAMVAAAAAVAEGVRENSETRDLPDDVENRAIDATKYFWYGMLQVSKHYEEGAAKYGENNWQNGMPLHVYYDSACRHLMKARAGMEDEPHIRAACWNALCFIWTYENKPELNDLVAAE